MTRDGSWIHARRSLLHTVVYVKVPAYLYHVWRNKCKTRRRKALFLGCLVVFLTAPIPVNRRIARLPLWDRYDGSSGTLLARMSRGLTMTVSPGVQVADTLVLHSHA